MSDHVTVTDPTCLAEAHARMRAIKIREREAANRLVRQQAVAPMAMDDERPGAASIIDAYPAVRAEWAAAVLRGDVQTATVRDIIRAVAITFGLTYADVVGPGRQNDLVRARWAAIHALRQAKPHLSLLALGRAFRRDHTTILYAIRRVEAEGVPQPPARTVTGGA